MAKKGCIPWNKGLKINVTWGDSISRATKGKPKSIEHAKKISQALTGKPFSEERKKNISLSLKGRVSWNKGKRKATHPEMKNTGNMAEQHWAWKGGVSSINARIRSSSEYKVWRESVFIRDRWTCQHCFKKPRYVEADHIKPFVDYPQHRFDVNNGRTLCRRCHKAVTAEQRKLTKISSVTTP
jgi:hypothetical protein